MTERRETYSIDDRPAQVTDLHTDEGEDLELATFGKDDEELKAIADVMRVLKKRSAQSQGRIVRYLYSRIVYADMTSGLPF